MRKYKTSREERNREYTRKSNKRDETGEAIRNRMKEDMQGKSKCDTIQNGR